MRNLKAGCAAPLVLLLAAGVYLALGWPHAPLASPREYPVSPVTPIPQKQNAWEEYRAADKAQEKATLDSSGFWSQQPDEAGLRSALGHLRTARKLTQFRVPPRGHLSEYGLLSNAYQQAQRELVKEDVEPALDYLAAVSRLSLGPGWAIMDMPIDPSERTPEVIALLDAITKLSAGRRREVLDSLDRWVNEQTSVTDHIILSRESYWHGVQKSTLIGMQKSSRLLRSSGLKGVLERRSEAARPSALRILRIKFDRWIFFVRDGDLDGLHADAAAYWSHRPPEGWLGKWIWTARFLIVPAQVLSTLPDLPPFAGVVGDSLSQITVTYNERRLVWEAGRLRLALELFAEDKGRLPLTLDELVSMGYLAKIPLDPYRLKGSESQRLEDSSLGYDGSKAWSIGWDGVDQQGVESVEEFVSISSRGDRILWRKRTRQ